MQSSSRKNQSGSTILEFAIVAPFLIIALFGTIGVGISLGRFLQTVQVCRDIDHMYTDGVDFTQTGAQNIAVQLAQGSGMTTNGGNGVIILSRISTIYQADCDAAGYTATCNNLNQAVFTQRVTVGNTALRASNFGTPNGGILDAQGNISPSVYMQNTDTSVRTSNFTSQLTAAGTSQQRGDVAWVAEVYFSYPDLSFLGNYGPAGTYTQFIF